LISLVTMPLNVIFYEILNLHLSVTNKQLSIQDIERGQGFKTFDWIPKCFKSYVLFFTFPFNRFIAHSFSNIFYLVCLCLVITNPADIPVKIDIDWYDVLLPVLTIAFICIDCKLIYQNHKVKFNMGALIFNLLFHLIILIGTFLRGIGFYLECKKEFGSESFYKDCTLDNPALERFHKYLSPVIYGYGMYGVGVVMGALKILQWSQISHRFGPFVISLKEVINDIKKVIFSFGLFILTFSIAIKYVMDTDNTKCDGETEEPDTKTSWDIEEKENKFKTYPSSFKVSLWSVFDPGHPEVVGCTMQGIPRYLAMSMWWVYQCIIVIVLMNLLIALMNATMNSIQSDRIQQWKFARTTIWLQFFDRKNVLPVPFNMFGYLIGLCVAIFNNFKTTDKATEKSRSCETEESYVKLVGELCKRYLTIKEDSKENEVTKEDLDNAKREIMTPFQAYTRKTVSV